MKADERTEGGSQDVYQNEILAHDEVLKSKKLTFQDVRDHMSGPVLSLMLHVVLIAFLSAIIVIKGPEKEDKKIKVDFMEVIIKDPIELPPPPKDIPLPDDPDDDVPLDTTPTPIADPDVPPVKPVEVPPMDPVDIPPLKITKSALELPFSAPPSMRFRGPEARRRKIGEHTNNPEGQNALERGLRWLRDHQNPDGSWGDSNKGNISAYTGLAVLAFLGRGETPSSTEYGITVLKGIKKLIEFTGSDAMGVKGGYRHGIVMYALAEAYAMTKIPMLEEVVSKGTTRIVQGQNANGSFNYGYANSKMRSDLSVAGWNFQAMKAAFHAGCDVPGLVEAIDKSIDVGLKKTHNVTGGGFRYDDKGGAKGSMTAVGTLCLQLFEPKKSKAVKAGVRYLEQPNYFWFSWKGKDKKVPQWGLYQWYYQTQVFFQAYEGKGRKWRKWDRMFAGELVRRQKKDGRWESPEYEFGTKEKKGHGEGSFKGLDQPVYSTALSCLMLEVYYRHMTTSAARNLEIITNKAMIENDDDLGLKLKDQIL